MISVLHVPSAIAWTLALVLMSSVSMGDTAQSCGADDAADLQKLQTSTRTDPAALLSAIHQLHARSTIWLLEHGESADARDENGTTALMYLMASADVGRDLDSDEREPLPRGVTEWPCTPERHQAERTILDALLGRKPDLEARSASGSTALLVAAKRKRFDLVLSLQSAGADINAADVAGKTAIFFAPRVTLESLVKAGAHINAADANGDTILHAGMRAYGGSQLLAFVDTALRLGAHDSRNKQGEWASEAWVDSIPFLDMPDGLTKLNGLRRRLKATRVADPASA